MESDHDCFKIFLNITHFFKVLNLLDLYNVKYERKMLNVGDYSWIWRQNGHDVELPHIIE